MDALAKADRWTDITEELSLADGSYTIQSNVQGEFFYLLRDAEPTQEVGQLGLYGTIYEITQESGKKAFVRGRGSWDVRLNIEPIE